MVWWLAMIVNFGAEFAYEDQVESVPPVPVHDCLCQLERVHHIIWKGRPIVFGKLMHFFYRTPPTQKKKKKSGFLREVLMPQPKLL